jgi:hypothetical protein
MKVSLLANFVLCYQCRVAHTVSMPELFSAPKRSAIEIFCLAHISPVSMAGRLPDQNLLVSNFAYSSEAPLFRLVVSGAEPMPGCFPRPCLRSCCFVEGLRCTEASRRSGGRSFVPCAAESPELARRRAAHAAGPEVKRAVTRAVRASGGRGGGLRRVRRSAEPRRSPASRLDARASWTR